MKPLLLKYYICFCLLLCCTMVSAQNEKQKKQEQERLQDFQLANEYLSSEKYEEATKILEDLIDKDFNYSYYQSLISAYSIMGEKKKKEKLLKKAVKKSNEQYNYVIDLGEFYLSEKQDEKANKYFEKSIDNLKANNSEIVKVANYFTTKGLYDYAVKTYNKGRKLLHNNTIYTYELSYIYQLQGRNDDIIKEYLVLLEDNPSLLNQVEVNINNLFNRDKDNKLFETLQETLLQKVKDNPKNEQLSRLYLWTLEKQGNYSMGFIQAKAIDKRFDKENSNTLFNFASNAMNNQQYDIAVKSFDFIINKNEKDVAYYERSMIAKMNCEYKEFKDKHSHTEKEKQKIKEDYVKTFKELGYTSSTSSLMQEYANLLAYDFHQPQEAVDILDSLINMKNVSVLQKANAKIERADIYLLEGDIWEASLTYSQVSKDLKNENEGSVAKFKNAMLSYFTGDFQWAESQFETLRASTSKLIANDAMEYSLLLKENLDEDSSYNALSYFAKADFYIFQNRLDEAEKTLDTIETSYLSHPIFDEVLYKKGEIAYKKQEYEKADSLWSTLLMKYSDDITADDAVFALAKLNEDIFKNKSKALEYYQKIILDYPSSLYISIARKKNAELEQTLEK